MNHLSVIMAILTFGYDDDDDGGGGNGGGELLFIIVWHTMANDPYRVDTR
jgi:hypothetical protein